MRTTLTLISKQELISNVFIYKFSLNQQFEWTPGQFVVLQIDPKTFRSYSIVDLTPTELTLLIDIKVGGPASLFFSTMTIGESLQMIGKPLGKFILTSKSIEKYESLTFIATGTGIAPFVPMINFALQNHSSLNLELLFGARTLTDDYANFFFPEHLITSSNLKIHHCLSAENKLPISNKKNYYYSGRVTKILPELNISPITSSFYICGNPRMVEETNQILKNQNAKSINFEKYGK